MINVRFFILFGAVLIVSGVLQLLVRPRREREAGLQRVLNRSSIWALLCVLVGVLGVLVGLGVVPLVRM